MNGNAIRRAFSAGGAEGAPPSGLLIGDATPESDNFGARIVSHRSWIGRVRQISYAAIDVLLVCVGSTVAFVLRFGVPNPSDFEVVSHRVVSHRQLSLWASTHGYPGYLLLYCALIVLGCISQHLYRTPRGITSFAETLRVLKAVALATSLLVLFIFTSGNKEISRLVVASAGCVNALNLAGWRFAKRWCVLRRADRGEGLSRVLIIGAGKVGQAFAGWIESNRHLGYSVCGFLDPHPNGDKRVLGSVEDLRRVALAQFVDEVFITPPADGEMVKQAFLEARKLRMDLHVVPDLYDGLGWRAPLRSIAGFPVIELHAKPIPALGLVVKRATDLVLAIFGLIMAAPILAVAAIWIRLDSPGPVIYSAPRIGRKGKKFCFYKLRTMIDDADRHKEELRNTNDRNGPFFKMENDPRITRAGRWLRRFSIDELPQLLNVLRGDMSLVGPRPHPVDDYERYSLDHLRRLDVKPGVSGLWQVMARRDPSFETSIALDLEYIENWTLWLDMKILWRTLPVLLRADGR
jgi:exopolysaccharide biosynthesis polyprenyl glycosylphosphotransferase